jgi:hypothetical protein
MPPAQQRWEIDSSWSMPSSTIITPKIPIYHSPSVLCRWRSSIGDAQMTFRTGVLVPMQDGKL